MQDKFDVSIIIPVFNGEKHLRDCIDVTTNQNFEGKWEIIFIDDASTDDSLNLIKKINIANIKVFSLNSNSGQSAARNFGIQKAKGDYLFFMDVDDVIEKHSLSVLFNKAKELNCDFVCSDFKRVENSSNQRENLFNYPTDMMFDDKDLLAAMHRELNDPTLGHLGLFGCNGRLIKRSLIVDNKIYFEEKLRWLEDKTFCWNVFGFLKNAFYIRQQLYCYRVYPNLKTAVTESLINNFSFENIKLINKHIRNSLVNKNVSSEETEALCMQALIFHSIQVLISLTRTIFLKKVELEKGMKIRKTLIYQILNDDGVLRAIKHYEKSKKESFWIPLCISLKSSFLLELACDYRTRQVINKRRGGKE